MKSTNELPDPTHLGRPSPLGIFKKAFFWCIRKSQFSGFTGNQRQKWTRTGSNGSNFGELTFGKGQFFFFLGNSGERAFRAHHSSSTEQRADMSMSVNDGVIAQAKMFRMEFIRLQEEKASQQVLRKAPSPNPGGLRMGIPRP